MTIPAEEGDARGYPVTPRTWIDDELARGEEGRAAVWHHVMSVYAEPLRAFAAVIARDIDAADAVHEFLLHRIGDRAYFDEWRRSGRRLRDWLRSGLEWQIRTLRRAEGRRRECGDSNQDPPATKETDPEAIFDRALALSIVLLARSMAEAECRASGLADHWQVFSAHAIEGRPYASLMDEWKIDENRATRMNDTAKKRFARCLRDVVRRDGVPESRIDATIRDLMAALEH